jgi:signal peptidase I
LAEPRAGTSATPYPGTSHDTQVSCPAPFRRPVRRWLDRLALVVIGTAVGLLVHIHVLGIVVVDGESMAPSLHKGDHLLIEKVSPRLGVVDRGDVVVLRKGDSGELLVKRVVATAGEVVRAWAGRVYVDGKLLHERDYADMNGVYSFPECLVGPSELFVLGDNRDKSEDSATWGCVSVQQVIGRCLTGPLQGKPRAARHQYADGSGSMTFGGRPLRAASPRGSFVNAQ